MVRVSPMTSMIGSVTLSSVIIMAVPLKWMLRAPLAFALSAGGGGEKREQSPPPQPATAAQPSVSQNPPNQYPPSEDTRPVIAAFGDSISEGFGVEPGKSFPDDLQGLLDAAGYRYNVVNLGVSGNTTTDGVERLPSVLAVHPVIVILEFGGNDGLRGLPVTAARKNLAEMIEAFQKAHASILLAGMTLPRNYGPEYIQ